MKSFGKKRIWIASGFVAMLWGQLWGETDSLFRKAEGSIPFSCKDVLDEMPPAFLDPRLNNLYLMSSAFCLVEKERGGAPLQMRNLLSALLHITYLQGSIILNPARNEFWQSSLGEEGKIPPISDQSLSKNQSHRLCCKDILVGDLPSTTFAQTLLLWEGVSSLCFGTFILETYVKRNPSESVVYYHQIQALKNLTQSVLRSLDLLKHKDNEENFANYYNKKKLDYEDKRNFFLKK